MRSERSEADDSKSPASPAASYHEGAAGDPGSHPSSRPGRDVLAPGSTHRVAGFHRIPVQQAEEWCWAAVCLALLRWRGLPASLCDVVRRVRGVDCTRHGPGCQHRDCRQPESLARALRVLGIPHQRIPSDRRWERTLDSLRQDRLVACEIPFEGGLHAVLLTSATPATGRQPAWIGVDDPLPLRNEHRLARLYQGGFRPTFLAAVGRAAAPESSG